MLAEREARDLNGNLNARAFRPYAVLPPTMTAPTSSDNLLLNVLRPTGSDIIVDEPFRLSQTGK